MPKAFLFDMDGVLADSENRWIKAGYDNLLKQHFGEQLFNTVKINGGMSIKGIFDAYVEAGFTGDYADFHAQNNILAKTIYADIPITEGTEKLIDHLGSIGYILGLVSSSPQEWIDQLVARLRNGDKLQIKLSVNNHETLRAKPAADGYVHAMQSLGVEPAGTFVLEDSQTGITAGLASGAKVICFTQYHSTDKVKPKADYYAATMTEVRQIVDKSEQA